MKRLVIFGMFVAIMITTSVDAFSEKEKIRKIKENEEKTIKEFLRIEEHGDKIYIYSSTLGPYEKHEDALMEIPATLKPHIFSTSEFKEILDKEMSSEEAPGLTYGIYILNAINEMKMVESVWTQEYKHKTSAFFNAMLEMNTSWSSGVSYTAKKFLSSYSTSASTLLLSYDIAQIGISIKAYQRLRFYNSLWWYFEERGGGNSHEEAWKSIQILQGWSSQNYRLPAKGLFESEDEYRKKLSELEKYFKRLWNKYRSHLIGKGLSKEFKQQNREELNMLLIKALEEARLPVLPLPAWEEVSPKNGLVTALVIDRSGSMSGDKIKRAKEAAYVYVDASFEQGDMVSLAAFSSSAESIAEPVSIVAGREKLKKDIFSLSPGGRTNVGAGLKIALLHLSSCNLKDKTAVLLSDGRHNKGSYKPEVAEFQKRGWPISTVAFGRNADQETLAWIAYQTGGSFFPASLPDIARVYHKINIQAHHSSVFRCYSDFIRPGARLTYNIPVEPDMKKVGFFTNWQGSKMETTLFSPNKAVINRYNFKNWGGRFVEGETHNCFEIDNPQSGNWQALITGYDLPPQGEQINFHSFCQSDIFSNILGFQSRYSRNKPVRIGVKLAEVINGRLSPLRGARVTAEIKKPSTSLKRFASGIRRKRLRPENLLEIFREISGSAQKITLFDDGLHQDVLPGDGIYANTYNDTTINGPYLVTIDCQGNTSRGMPIKRTLQESFQVGRIEQNSFTVSDFLDLINQQGARRYLPSRGPKRTKEQETEKIVESLLRQLLKKKRR